MLLLIIAGTVVLLLPISGPNGQGLSFNQALFTTVSAVTGTGLSIIVPATDLSVFGQVVLMLLMEIGGLGFVMTSIIVFRLLGRRVTLAERLTLRDSLGLPNNRDLATLSVLVLAGVLIIELIGALLLWLTAYSSRRALIISEAALNPARPPRSKRSAVCAPALVRKMSTGSAPKLVVGYQLCRVASRAPL